MLTKLSLTAVMVLDQDEALDFYVNKLGLEVSQDWSPGLTRLLTVRIPGDPGLEIALEQPGPPVHDIATAEQIRELVTKGAMTGLTFLTDDARSLFELLVIRGVTDVMQEPIDHPYGIDFGIRDPFGNAIRILQPATFGSIDGARGRFARRLSRPRSGNEAPKRRPAN